MTTFDLHQHLWPPSFIEALRERTSAPHLDEGDELVTREGRFPVALRAHELETRVRSLDRDGIDVGVISLQPSLGLAQLEAEECRQLEEAWCAGARELVESSGGRLRAFSPRVLDGFAGVSVGSGTFADFDAATPLLDAVSGAGLLLFVHPEAAAEPDPTRPEWWEWVVGYPSRMQEAYLSWLAFGRERWPTLRVLFAILAGGGPFQLERLARQGVEVRSALDPNTFFDVSTHGRRAIELCIETFGVGQLVYGSDTPVVDPKPTLDAVRGFGDAVTHVLQRDTPERLLT